MASNRKRNDKKRKSKQLERMYLNIQKKVHSEEIDEDIIIKPSKKYIRKELVSPYLSKGDIQIICDTLKKGTSSNYNIPNDFIESIDHIVHDIFCLYFNPESVLHIDSHNKGKLSLLIRLIDHMSKIITDNNYITSFIFTKYIYEYILELFNIASVELADKITKVISGGGTDEDIKDVEAFLDITSKNLQSSINKAKRESYKLSGIIGGDDPENLTLLENIDSILKSIRSLKASSQSINKAFKTILKESTNYFNRIREKEESALIDCDYFEELEDYFYLCEPLDQYLFHQLSVTNSLYKGKVDIYIDGSSSMGREEVQNSRICVAKGLSIKMLKKGYAENFYIFDTSLTPISSSPIYIMTTKAGGGTNFSKPLSNIDKTRKNSIIITDGEDSRISHYHRHVYWVGIENNNFRSFNSSENGQKYLKNGQCLYYNGKDFKKVKYEENIQK